MTMIRFTRNTVVHFSLETFIWSIVLVFNSPLVIKVEN